MLNLLEHFDIDGEIEKVAPYGEGHINSTYKVDLKNSDVSYILQKINTTVFKDYEGVINNIRLVTDYLKNIIQKNGGDVNRETMTLIPAKDGKYYYMTEDGECYRIYTYVTDTVCYQTATPERIESSGYAFGNFMKNLDGFDASKLVEVIPHFHETPIRYNNFLNAVTADKVGRLKDVLKEVEFFEEREGFYSVITDMLDKGTIPNRVTHNDTKLNNILFDSITGDALCVVDLDTIMPGSLLYDFGDSVRFGCSTALEDEKDTSKIHFDLNLYESYLRGYLKGAGDKITRKEVENLHNGSIMMTLECGMRFLTDYLEGDVYFKTAYPEHNLVRATSQIILAKEMEQNKDKMIELAYKYFKD